MTVTKPTPHAPQVSELQAYIGELESSVEKLTKNGTEPLSTLKLKQQRFRDEEAQRVREQQIREIEKAYPRTIQDYYTVQVEGGRKRVYFSGSKLFPPEIRELLAAFEAAKEALQAADTSPADGRLQPHEWPNDAGKTLSDAFIQNLLKPWTRKNIEQLQTWRAAVAEVLQKLENRQLIDVGIVRAAEHHAATPQGAQALIWAYRTFSLMDPQEPDSVRGSVSAMLMNLREAERDIPWSAKLPFVGKKILDRVTNAPGHLDDAEIKQLLKTEDLEAFVADMQREIQLRLGFSYERYLAGEGIKDLETAIEQSKDPDYRP